MSRLPTIAPYRTPRTATGDKKANSGADSVTPLFIVALSHRLDSHIDLTSGQHTQNGLWWPPIQTVMQLEDRERFVAIGQEEAEYTVQERGIRSDVARLQAATGTYGLPDSIDPNHLGGVGIHHIHRFGFRQRANVILAFFTQVVEHVDTYVSLPSFPPGEVNMELGFDRRPQCSHRF
jgi:hypothetical protein